MQSRLVFALFVSTALSAWLAAVVGRRPTAPGARPLAWLTGAVALWAFTSALHGLAETLSLKLFWAKLQYVGIASVAPLWLLFAADYAGAAWLRGRTMRRALWVVPVVTMALAATNESHLAIWPDVYVAPSGVTVYEHGWWFWLAAAYNYAVLFVGTLLVAKGMLRFPPAFRTQRQMVVAAALVPWAANLAYLTGLSNGLDWTPIAFAASGLLFALALYRNQLLDLVPVARDMVIDSLSDAVVVIDSAYRVIDMNRAARQLVATLPQAHSDSRAASAGQDGNTADHAIGRHVDDVMPPVCGALREAGASGTASFQLVVRGREVFFELQVMPVKTTPGSFAASVVLLRDVTEKHRAAAEREALRAKLQEQQHRENLGVLAAGLAHDFNNLLAGIMGNADLLALQLPHRSELGGNVGAILLGAQRAAALVSKVQAYAGQRPGSASRVDIDALSRELLPIVRVCAPHCVLEYTGAPAPIDADAPQIRQVVMTLVINATEAVSDHGGRVTIATGVEVLTEEQLRALRIGHDASPGAFAFLEVRDNGIGMDEDTQRRLFTPFFTTKPSGHGLALAAVQGIVIGHRGALRVESGPGQGATFRVWFPAAQSEIDCHPAPPSVVPVVSRQAN